MVIPPWDACVLSEVCDEGSGTTDYIAICLGKFRNKGDNNYVIYVL